MKKLPKLGKDKLFVINRASESKTKAHKVEETVDKGSSLVSSDSNTNDKEEDC